jgi:hypothetical protein
MAFQSMAMLHQISERFEVMSSQLVVPLAKGIAPAVPRSHGGRGHRMRAYTSCQTERQTCQQSSGLQALD